jgi:threonine/homoserine/homoserine lactone efflux protein
VAETLRVVLYGIVAAASPMVLLATFVVLGSGRGRLNGIVFAAAFLLGQCIAYLAAFLLGSAVTPGDDKDHQLVDVLELVVGVSLLGFAWQRRSRHAGPSSQSTPRTEAVFARLADVRPVVSFGIGMPLGVGAKRLMITILAATTVAVAGFTGGEEFALSAVYVAVATVVVWAPVALYVVFGEHADRLMAESRRWIATHEESLAVVSALAFGVLLIGDALVGLLR